MTFQTGIVLEPPRSSFVGDRSMLTALLSLFALSPFGTLSDEPPPQDVLSVTASLDASSLEVGGRYRVLVSVKVDEGWSTTISQVPKPILQIQVPACASLEGKVLETYKELSRVSFLRMPFERVLGGGSESVAFELTSEPKAGDAFAFNVVAFVSRDPETSSWFVRRRVLVDIVPGARGKADASGESSWGADPKLLQIGKHVEPFELPRADGSIFRLADHLGKRPVLVTTYRAFW